MIPSLIPSKKIEDENPSFRKSWKAADYLLIVGTCVDVNFCRIHAHYERSKFSTLQLGRTDT